MKKLVVLLFTSLISFTAFAGDIDDDFKVEVLSWCDKEKVMQYNDNNEIEARVDCAEQGQVCRTYSFSRWNVTKIVATCEKPN